MQQILAPLADLFDLFDVKRKRRLHWIVGKFRRRGGFAPAELVQVFNSFEQHGIDYQRELYPITLRSKNDRQGFMRLSNTDREIIWPCLSAAQKKRYQISEEA